MSVSSKTKHELKQPLSVISSIASYIEMTVNNKTPLESKEMKEILESIYEEVDKMDVMITGLE